MDLGGQGHGRLDAHGFTMVVLLVVMAIMAVGMTAMLPRWHQQALREKEDELVFRGNQYARALVLYSRKNGNQLPNNIDVLYTGRYLRKKYKDPITGEDFGLLGAGTPPGAAPGRGGQGTAPTGQAAGRGGQPTQPPRGGGSGLGAPAGTQIVGSINGVYSKSTDTSIRVYQNQQRYIDWPFTVQTAQLAMGSARGGGAPQQPGRGGGVDGRGGGAPGRGAGAPGRGGGVDGRGDQGPGRGGVAPPGGRTGGPPAIPGRGGRGGGI